MTNTNPQFLRQQTNNRQLNWLRFQMVNRLRRTNWTPNQLADELWLIGSTLSDSSSNADPVTVATGSSSAGTGFVAQVTEAITAVDELRPGIGKGRIFQFDGSQLFEIRDSTGGTVGPQDIYNTTSATVAVSDSLIQVKVVSGFYFIDVEDCGHVEPVAVEPAEFFTAANPVPQPWVGARGRNPLWVRTNRVGGAGP